MAWIHSMWIVSPTEKTAKAIKDYFNSLPPFVYEEQGYKITCNSSGMVSTNGPHIKNVGISSIQEAHVLSILGFEYYKRLKNAPDFSYALTGVEVDAAILLQELLEDPEWPVSIAGFVLHQSLYNQLGQPGDFVPFKKDYLWNPYLGESYINPSKRIHWQFADYFDVPRIV